MVHDQGGVKRFQLQRRMAIGKVDSGPIELSPKTETADRFERAFTEMRKRSERAKTAKPSKKLRTYQLEDLWYAEGTFLASVYVGRGETERAAKDDWLAWAKSLQP
jgi:hypothetical protein